MRFFIRLMMYGYILIQSISLSYANIIITGTRFVYPENTKEINIQLSNSSETPRLVQSWLDKGDPKARPGSEYVPFLITPPITRVEGHQGQSLRVRYIDKNLPQDRETLLWLNVLEVPPTAKNADQETSNSLQLAIRSRLKFFFRPESLKSSPEQAIKNLQWQVTGSGSNTSLTVKNPTPYYFSFHSLNAAKQEIKLTNVDMVAPFSSAKISPGHAINKASDFSLKWINDRGRVLTQSYRLQ